MAVFYSETELGEWTRALSVERVGTSDASEMQSSLSIALVGKGALHGRLGQVPSEVAAYNEVIDRFGTSDIPELQSAVATALACKAISQAQYGETHAAIGISDEVANRFGGSSVPEIRAQVAIALWARTGALLTQNERFRAMYVALVPDQQELVRLLLACVPELIAIGTSERELLDILSSDRKKTDAVIPLMVALRQRTGEIVRAPAEVLEVAADIGKQIEAKTETGDAGDLAAPES